MVLGPFVVWLIYAHFFRDFGPQDQLREAVVIGVAMVAGSLGALSLGSPFNRWSLSAKLVSFAVYGTALAFVVPLIAMLAICTKGDCL